MSKNKFSRLLLVLIACVSLFAIIFTQTACDDITQPATTYYTVTFVTGEGSSVSSQQVESGKRATRPADPAYSGYTFGGWYTDEQCTDGNEYDFTKTVTDNLNLYAKWNAGEAPAQHTHTAGAWVKTETRHYRLCTDANCPTPDERLDMGAHNTSGADGACSVCGYKAESEKPNPPVQHTHTKGEWIKTDAAGHYKLCTDANCPTPTEKLDVAAHDTNGADGACSVCGYKAATTPVEPDVTEYTVTFNAGEGAVWTDSKLKAQLVEKGATAARPDDPVKSGYVLENWLTADGKVYNFATPVTADITLTAKWAESSAKIYYTVSFVTGEGAGKVSSQEVEAGKKAVIPEAPVMNGGSKVFDCWCVEGTAAAYNFDTPVTKNITLVAKWKDASSAETYVVTFNTDGGSNVPAQLVENGGKAAVPSAPTKAGYTFNKWLKADGTEYDFNSPVTADITLKADWSEKATPPDPSLPDQIPTYAELAAKEGNVLAEDFETAVDKLGTFSGSYGTKGLYSSCNADVTTDTHYIKVEGGKAQMVDPGAGEARLVVDFGQTSGLIEGYFEITLKSSNNSWTPVRLVGADGAELFALRTDGGQIKYRLDGSSTVIAPETNITTSDTTYKIYFRFESETKKFSMAIDGKTFVENIELSSSSIGGLLFVSSNSNSRTVAVDNLAIVNEHN